MNRVNRNAAFVVGPILLSFVCAGANAQNLINNGGFETPINSVTDWGTFGNAYQIFSGGPTPHGGTGEAKLYGNFSGSQNTSGFYQDFTASAGETFDAAGFGQNWSGDTMEAGNEAFMQVTFFDSSNNEIAGSLVNSANIDLNTPTDTWTALSIDNVLAPTGTAYGQFLLLFTQPAGNYNGGSAWFDDVSVVAAPTPEPMTILGLSLGAAALVKRRKARN